MNTDPNASPKPAEISSEVDLGDGEIIPESKINDLPEPKQTEATVAALAQLYWEQRGSPGSGPSDEDFKQAEQTITRPPLRSTP